MSRPPRFSHQLEALAAYAAPIEAEARVHAAAVLDAIELDVRTGATSHFSAELRDVRADEEWCTAPRLDLFGVPPGAVDWAKLVWCRAFQAELSSLGKKRSAERSANAEQRLREHFRLGAALDANSGQPKLSRPGAFGVAGRG